METVKIDKKHTIGKIYDFNKKPHITFTCATKHHAYSYEQPFDFCPSCGKQLPPDIIKLTNLWVSV